MSKLIAIYKQPDDPEAFDRAYFQEHLPLMAQVPGLQKTVVTRFTRKLMGEDLYMITEMFFADHDALKNAMRSPEMAAAGDNLNSFAQGLASLFFGEEEMPSSNPDPGTILPKSSSKAG